MSDVKSSFKLTVLITIAMMTWGLSWTNAKILGAYGSPNLMMIWRFFIAIISFFPVVWITGNSFQLSKISFRYIILNSLCMVSYNYFYFKGTQIGFAGAGGVLVTTLNPTLTALFSGLFFGGLLTKKDGIGLLLGFFSGGLIIQIWRMDLIQLFNSGNIYFLLASLSWVSVTILTSKAKDHIPFITYSFWSFTISFFISVLLGSEESLFIVFSFDWVFWLNMLFLAVAAMSFGTSIYFMASVKLGPKRASAYIFTVPITAMIFAVIFLNEPIEVTTLLGGLIGVIAVYLINK